MTDLCLDAEGIVKFRSGIAQFNERKFFECHDTLEEVWSGSRGPMRDFLQGLIQVAVGFYHLGNGNFIGAESQLTKGLVRLQPFGDAYGGIDLSGLRAGVLEWLNRMRSGAISQGELPDLPRIELK